jgi:hypothetical protein
MLNSDNMCDDLLDIIEFNYYKCMLVDLHKPFIYDKPILKDATASFMQNLVRLMGYKNEDSLRYTNLLSDDCWYDTYSYIINQ